MSRRVSPAALRWGMEWGQSAVVFGYVLPSESQQCESDLPTIGTNVYISLIKCWPGAELFCLIDFGGWGESPGGE